MIKLNLTLRSILTIAVFVLCAMMFSTVSFAQGPSTGGQTSDPTADCPKLMYQYDVAGNRIKRYMHIDCPIIERTAPAPQNAVAQQEEARKKILAKSAEAIQVFPNPAQKYLMLECPNEWINAGWTLMGGNGEMITSGQVQSAVGEINVSNLANGNYFLKVELDGVAKTYKIMKVE